MNIEVIEQAQHENQLQFHPEQQEAFKHIASLRPDATLYIPRSRNAKMNFTRLNGR